MSVVELRGILDKEELHDVQLIDVREAEELRLASLPRFAPLPLSRYFSGKRWPNVSSSVFCTLVP